jgi:hypothetical protein
MAVQALAGDQPPIPPGASSGSAPTIGELQQTHPQYRLDLITQYQTWYDGGHRFREALDADEDGTYLGLRRCDSEKLDERWTYRQLRKAKAQFSSEIGRIIASMQATILRNPPTLIDDDEHIRNLNSDADGAGTDLREIARQILECGLLHARAYLGPTFPGVDTHGLDLEQATKAGALDGRLRFYHARNVPWWSHAPDGRLQACRIYTYEDKFSRGTWGTLEGRTHRWVVVDDKTITVYEHLQEAVSGQLIPLVTTKTVTAGPSQPHGYDKCPIREFQFGKSFWVADRLVDPQKRLFNSEADEAFIRSECAHPQRIINGMPASEQNAEGRPVIKASPIHGIHFPDGNGSYNVVGPDAAQNIWHGSAIERDRGNLYAALESLYLGLANQSQNARQAASAKAMDASHSTLFMSFAAALLEVLIVAVVKDIKAKRSPATTMKMEGLNKIDGRSIDQAITEAKSFFELSPPPTARRFVLASLTTRMMAGAEESDTQKAVNELVEAGDVSAVDINGAVAQGLISLVTAGLMSEEEARAKIGLSGPAPKPFSPAESPAGAPNPGMPKPAEGDMKEGQTNEDEDNG